MQIEVPNVILKMVAGIERDDREFKDGEWVKTGRKKTAYESTFITNDEFKEKLVFFSDADYSKFEGKVVTLNLKIAYNDFEKKMKAPTLQGVYAAKSA